MKKAVRSKGVVKSRLAGYSSPMKAFEAWLESVAGIVWGWPLVILLFGTHLFLTFRLGFIQRHIGKGIRLSIAKDKGAPGDVSHFGALATALAATIGTGNIYGVAGAVLVGGPGAVLWMWLTGIFGIATKYGEAVLAVKYRTTNARGEMAGGPMYVIERGLKWKWLAVLFALFTTIAAFGIGNMTQANAISEMSAETFPGIEKWMVGAVLSIATGFVLLGGIRWIARACEVLVPFMALFYGVGCIILLIMNWSKLPDTVQLIFSSAFTGQAAVGGFVGAGIKEVMRAGIARGLFSNEAGLGSAPIVAAAARTSNPVRQALVSSTGTFWDTVVICALTGLVIVSSGDWSDPGMTKATLCKAAFSDLSSFGTLILTVGLFTFVFSTILGWSYYGERALEYLAGPRAILPYRVLWVVVVFVGAVWEIKSVWNFADIMNGLMAVPNLISLILLSGVIAAETKKHIGHLDD